MPFTMRDLAPDDAGDLADLMRRIEADHPTGFCLAADEVVELMRDKPDSVFEGAFDEHALVGFTTVIPAQPQEEHRLLLFGDVDPERLGEGLGTTLFTRSLERARAIHADVAPGVRARYATAALADRPDQADLMLAAGMESGRHGFLMVADLHEELPSPRLPDGLTVTDFDVSTAEELRLAHNAAFADYPDGSDLDAEFWTMFMVRASHNRPHLAAVARDGSGAVAGYVFAHEYVVAMSGGTEPEIYVPYVGTLPAHRGRGLATGLLTHVLHTVRAEGFATASLNVDTHNPTGALGIYERAGFRQSYRQDFYHLRE